MDSIHKMLLAEFFDCKFEKTTEKAIIDNSFENVQKDVLEYVEKVNSIPVGDYIEYIRENGKRQPIMASDVFQFSDFDDATINICKCINSISNPGLRFKEVAKLLFTDGMPRKDAALSKYGENHIKTAESLGLAFKDSHKNYYLSALGCVFSGLNKEMQTRLLTRLIIKNKLFTQLFISSLQGEFDLEAFLYDLSRSTYVRRRTNINRVIEFLNQSKEYDFSYLTQNIIY